MRPASRGDAFHREVDGSGEGAGAFRCVGRPAEQLVSRTALPPGGLTKLGPRDQDALVVLVRRGGRVHQFRLLGRGHARHGSVVALPGQVPVTGEYGGIDGGPHGQLLGDAAMQFAAPTRWYLVVHGLPEQVVPEPVRLRVDHHQVSVASTPECVRHPGGLQFQRVGNQHLVAVLGHCHNLECGDHLGPLLGDPGHEHAPQMVRQACVPQRQDLLQQQRDAPGPPVKALCLGFSESPPGDHGGQVSDLRRGKRFERDSCDRTTAGHRIDERAEFRRG